MLSRKVTCAIIILNELYSACSNIRTGSKMLRRATLVEKRCGSDSQTFRRVMQQLCLCGYVTTVSSSAVLTCNPAELLIYELFVALHGGIPIGEATEQYYEVNHFADRGYPKIEILQQDAADVFRKYFERKTVASMISVL